MYKQTFILLLLLLGAPVLSHADCGTQCLDQDKDGVIDQNDQCLESDPGAPVTISGCSHDTDADGVPDYRDKCPQPSAPPVDRWGCPKAIEIDLPGISFEVNSARLHKSSYDTLSDTVELLLRYGSLQAEIAGHTDDRGSAAHNRQLSRLRAKAVRQYLIDAGIAPASIIATGYGESRPIADNETEDGRSRNRRVVLRIFSGQPGKSKS